MSHSWFERLSALLIHEPKDREQLIEVLRDAEERNILSAEMLRMIESILHVSEKQVSEVMIPKAEMTFIEHDSNMSTLLPLVIESGHSRFPVMDETHEDVIGILLAKDLLKYCDKPTTTFNIKDMMRPAVFIPQSKRLDILLREFRVNRNHMAIVIDEYGHVSGLITIEDVLEEIVGEIEDEYDTDETSLNIKLAREGVFTVKAATPIDEFNTHFAAQLNDDEFNTIGGLVLKGFGHLPKRGETLRLGDFRFKILHSDNRRIYLLEVSKKA